MRNCVKAWSLKELCREGLASSHFLGRSERKPECPVTDKA